MASDGISFELKGVEDLQKTFKRVDSEVRRKGARFGLRKAANIVANKARAGAQRIDDPETASNIEKNIAVSYSSRHFKRTGDHKIRVGVRGGARTKKKKDSSSKNKGGDTFYWRFHEFGTKHHRARPFMRPALETSTTEAASEFINQTNKSIDRALKKAAKK